MAGPGRFPFTALLLSHCLDTGTSKAGLKIWTEDPIAPGFPLQLHCAILGQEHITQGHLQVTNISEGHTGLTVPSLDPLDNGTRYCCKFSTFPSGVSEQCLDLLLPEPAPDPPHAALRTEVLGTLTAGAAFLLGSIVVLCHLLRERAQRRRMLVISHPHPWLPSSQETPMALWIQQGLPGRRNSFSAPYVLINLDYFTPQPSATAHGGLPPPPLPPRPGQGRGQDSRESRAPCC